jgi:hypothetical protein
LSFADDSLRFGAPYNLFIFDAIVDRIWDIGQARFGARCMKTILDSPNTPKYQKVHPSMILLTLETHCHRHHSQFGTPGYQPKRSHLAYLAS